jgi:hypothetical protein
MLSRRLSLIISVAILVAIIGGSIALNTTIHRCESTKKAAP